MGNKKRVLFVGENPYGFSGNSHMMAAVLSQVNTKKYDSVCFGSLNVKWQYTNVFSRPDLFVIPGADVSRGDPWGKARLIEILDNHDFDVVFMVGVDIWSYSEVMNHIENLRNSKRFKWVYLFPYDLKMLREDWVNWIEQFDLPLVYSQYGYDMLKEAVPNVQYFRPNLKDKERFIRLTPEERKACRVKYFQTADVDNGTFFGFIGNNQIRKDPQTLIKAFSLLRKEVPNVYLYMHTDFSQGAYNLHQYCVDCGLEKGSIFIRGPVLEYSTSQIIELYNSFNYLVNCTLQEGLSWTVVESLLCGTPVIASESTAHIELIQNNYNGALVPCTVPSSIPLTTQRGTSFVDTSGCSAEDMANAMYQAVCMKKQSYEGLSDRALESGRKWVEGIDDVNKVLAQATKTTAIVKKKKKEAVLFVQHSSAGDVFMTTRCFKGIKERHKGLPLHYMTQTKYQDIIKGNPYIEEILDFDESKWGQYQFVYNPHKDRIMPGHWGRNANSILADFYWKIVGVEPDDFYIETKQPSFSEEKMFNVAPYQICIVHTTGGVPYYRTYKFMDQVIDELNDLNLFFIQLGGKNDYPVANAHDFRGLSFNESAWVMSKASLAITVDSFMSHLAGAFRVPQVCLFGSGNAAVVKPWVEKDSDLICMSPDYVRDCPGLGPCSGVVDCPVPCTGRHDPRDVAKNLEQLFLNKYGV